VLNNLGEMAYQQGDDARAEALSQESLALNRRLDDRQSIPMIHLNLGNVAARRSDLLAAESHYLESLAAHQRRGHRGAIAACLDGLANVALLSGKPEAAARLLGAATTFRAAGGETLPPADRAVHAQIVSAARAALAPAAFQAAWDAGAGLDIDTILAMYGRA
jgi:tetratricopeptide (TPR) repeat protein